MNLWKLTAAKTLVHETQDIIPVEGKCKVRVTKVLLDSFDSLVFQGVNRDKYPRILGRYAMGLLAEDGPAGLKKGTRVLLHASFPEEDTGTQKPDFTRMGRRVAGYTCDGFLRDFVFADLQELTVLPEAVNDDKALLIQYVALAKKAIDALNPQKGDHVAVIGADLLGFFICQLLIYQQVSPVLLDSRKERLDFAKSCGVYYSYLTDEDLMDHLSTVTGGRLCDGVIYTRTAGDDNLPYTVCAPQTTLVFCHPDEKQLSLPIAEILKKQLSVFGVWDGTDTVETAINLIANKAIDFTQFQTKLQNSDAIIPLFKDFMEHPERPIREINVINLL